MRDTIRVTRIVGGWCLVRCSGPSSARKYKLISAIEMPVELRPAKKGNRYLPYPTEADAERAARALADVWYPPFIADEEE